MLLTHFEHPRVASVFNVYATRVVGVGRIEWNIDENLERTIEEQKSEFDDRLFIRPAWAGKELHVIGTDRFTRTEIRLKIAGAAIDPSPRPPDTRPPSPRPPDILPPDTRPPDKAPDKCPPPDFIFRPPDQVPKKPLPPDFVVPPPGKVPKKFPKICDLLLGSRDIRFKRPDGSHVHLHHTGSKYFPSDIHVKINGRRIGTIKSDGSVSAEPDFSLDDLIDLVEEFCHDPVQAIKRIGDETGVCGVCGRELTNRRSIRLGIGPVCAGRVGSALGELVGN